MLLNQTNKNINLEGQMFGYTYSPSILLVYYHRYRSWTSGVGTIGCSGETVCSDKFFKH